MNLTLLVDEKLHNLTKTFEPHYNIVNLDYFKINGYLYLASTIIPGIANYLLIEEGNNGEDKDVLEKLKSMS